MTTIKKEADSANIKKDQKKANFCIDFHGAAIIDPDGHETAITEEMIEKVCEELEDDHSMTPYLSKSSKQDQT